MYQKLDTLTLKSGESVEAGVVKGPDVEWADRLTKLLWHKGEPWNWQNIQVLTREVGLDAFFYILHRDGAPLANIMTIEKQGIGLFGHVWTEPADRQKGASSALMTLQMQHFSERGGQALFLGTGYDSVAYHMYARFGFQSVEAQSGYMAYYRAGQADFEQQYFAAPTRPDELVVQPLQWAHWPLSVPLFLGDFPGIVRCVRAHIFGRESSEGGLLPLLLESEAQQRQDQQPATVVLKNQENQALLGLATCQEHPLWPDTSLLDIYCHPAYWEVAPKLLNALSLPANLRTLAYVDRDHQAKQALLSAQGFQAVATLPRWLATGPSSQHQVDVLMFAR